MYAKAEYWVSYHMQKVWNNTQTYMFAIDGFK